METNAAREPAVLEITVTQDIKSYKAYYRFFYLRNPTFWILWLAPLLIALPAFFSYNLRLLVVPGFFLLYTIILFIPGPRRSYQRMPKIFTESDEVYAFYQDDFQLTRSIQHLTTSQSVRYEFLKTAHETKDAFYLQTIDKNYGTYSLPKQYFTPEQMETMRALLEEKLGDQFKRGSKHG